MKQFNYPKGRLGEEIASEYLRKKEYKIIERNFNTRFGEIDLICTKDDLLIFVEVKLKIGGDFGTPEEMISPKKIYQVQRTAMAFLQKNAEITKKYNQYRVDVVAVVLNEDRSVKRINHYENVGF